MLDQDNETVILNNPGTSDQDLEELFAIKALIHNPDMILGNILAFEKFCWAVNGITSSPEIFDPPNLLMVAYAIKKAEEVLHKKLLFIEPHEHTTLVFIANIAYNEGWVVLPSVLSFAQHQLNKLTTPYCKQLFQHITNEYLLKTIPFDDEDPVSVHCVKTQAVQEYLKIMENK
jgi:hypothetical protein